MNYFNTTHEVEKLPEYEAKATTQDEKVLQFFKENKGRFFTPFDVHKKVFDDKTPWTSTRRAITNLTNKGLLYKSNTKQIEDFGRPQYTWCFLEIDVKGQIKVF